ncbi:hypothetical protein F5884DRAFT_738128 [Xylogone sp. PMI_703]|nr:hypothetical protein F5884DRAFT_738128 [Xylogone sp. PMI_703]
MNPSCIKDRRALPLFSIEPSKKPGTPLALYMPYLTFADHTDQKLKEHNNKLAEIYALKQVENSKKDSDREARKNGKILHRSRTLDQFYYHSLKDTKHRDKNQVVTRYINKKEKKNESEEQNKSEAKGQPPRKNVILRVDQVWLWVIDDKTIISCSSSRLDDRYDPVMEGIYGDIKDAKRRRKAQPTPISVDEMSKFITNFCINLIDKDTYKLERDELSVRQIFANTLDMTADEESFLFNSFDKRIRTKLERITRGEKKSNEEQHEDQKKEYESIKKAMDLLLEVKDIRDELSILNYLLIQQQSVWEKLLELPIKDYSASKEAEKWKGPGLALKDIAKMDKFARSIQDSVNSLLALEQNEVNISEAETSRELSQETIKQGRTLMVFTIITIIFLPMSFLASFFALNVTTFPHVGDNLVYEPKYIFSIIFGISTVIALPVIGFASKEWVSEKIKLLCQIYLKGYKSIQQTSQQIAQQRAKNYPKRSTTAEDPGPRTNSKVEPKNQPAPLEANGNSAPGIRKSSLENRTNIKIVSLSVLQEEDQPNVATGESNEHHDVGRWVLSKFRRRNRPLDEERAQRSMSKENLLETSTCTDDY